jgi:hypothetical protein
MNWDSLGNRITNGVTTTVLLCGLTAVALRAQTFTGLVTFDGSNGESPSWSALVQGTDSAFYGVTVRPKSSRSSTRRCRRPVSRSRNA